MSLSLAENVIVVGADNRPPMLDKTNYSSWASRMLLYIKGKEHVTVKARTYTDLIEEEKIRESADIKATNIVLQGLPQDIYNLVNHNEHAKEIWDRVKLLIQGSELSLQERESKLYDEFDMFTSLLGESIHSYYMRQHEAHTNEVRLTRQRYPDQIALVANSPSLVHQQTYQPPTLQQSYQAPDIQQPSQPSFPELDSGLGVPSFNPSDNPIASLNKAMAFLRTLFDSRYPTTNNQLRTSSYLRNQAAIQYGREIPSPVPFQTDDLDAFDSDCDDAPSAKAVLMANLSSYDSNVILEVPFHDIHIENDMSYQNVQETQCSQQPSFDNETKVDITSDSNIISYKQYLQETKNPVVQDTSSPAQKDELLMSVIEEMSSQVAKCNKVQHENKLVNETLTAELERYKEQIKIFEQRQKFDLNDREKYIDGQLRQHGLYKELKDMKAVFNQMETEVANCFVDKKHDTVHSDNVLPTNNNSLEHDNSASELLKHENDRLMKLLISQDLNENLVLKVELAKKHDMIEKAVYNELSKRCSRLENRCISLEIKLQQSKESFQTNRPSHNQEALEFKEFFIINELQALLKAKNVSIEKLNEHIANIKGKNVVESVQNVHNSNVVTSKVYKLDLQPLSPLVKHNRDVHVDYLKHTQENVDILCEIVKHARELRPLDSDLDSTCKFVTQIQEFLVYVSVTCPNLKHVSNKLVVVTPINRARKVRFAKSSDTSKDKTQKHVQAQDKHTTNNSVSPSTGVSSSTEDSGSKPRSNTKKDRISQTSSSNKKTNKVEDQPRIAKSNLNNMNRVSKIVCNANVKHSELIVLPAINLCLMLFMICQKEEDVKTYWIISTKVVPPRKSISTTPVKQTQPSSYKSGKLKDITNVGSSSKSKAVGSKISNHSEPMQNWGSNVSTTKLGIQCFFFPCQFQVVQIILWYLDSGCSKHMTGQRSQLIDFVSKFWGNVRFGNDQIAKIMGYGDYQLGNVTISQVYYVEGLGHNLFFVGQFCDLDLEVAFRKHTCYSSPICLLSKASTTKSWLWHRRLSHLNFGTLNQLAKQGLVQGLPKLKFKKGHLCSACCLGKSKKNSHKPKADDTNQEKLYLFHMDLCGPMRVESINGKKFT
ncbi:retrovirus-related pol polyprotein from transposon TNT 1-94 [Tanacetum coccineum]